MYHSYIYALSECKIYSQTLPYVPPSYTANICSNYIYMLCPIRTEQSLIIGLNNPNFCMPVSAVSEVSIFFKGSVLHLGPANKNYSDIQYSQFYTSSTVCCLVDNMYYS